jgi:hypothetical protein
MVLTLVEQQLAAHLSFGGRPVKLRGVLEHKAGAWM